MNHFFRNHFRAVAVLIVVFSGHVVADEISELKLKGTLLFAEDFNREDGSVEKDAMGNGWTSNSPWRADGRKQAFIKDGAIRIVTAQGAGHGVTIFHDIEPAFQDCVASFRYRMNDPTDTLTFDFNDPKCKTVHSGHLVLISIDSKKLRIQDSKTGVMDLEIRKRRKAGKANPELNAMLAKKQAAIPFESKIGQWYNVTIVTQSDLLRLFVDDKQVGELRSEGVAHATKRKLNIGAKKQSLEFDDIQIRAL